MSCYKITYLDGHKVAHQVKNREELLALRNDPVAVEHLRRARQGDAKAKMKLPQLNVSGHYPDGVVKRSRLVSRAFGFDVDNKEDFERIVPLLIDPESRELTELGDRLGLLMLERSVNQGGHAFFERELGKTILENQVRIACELRCEMDTNAHDINRVYFQTSGSAEDLIYVGETLFEDEYDEMTVATESKSLEERVRMGMERVPEGAKRAYKHYRPYADEGGTMAATSEAVTEVVSKASPTPTAENPTPQGVAQGQSLTYLGIPYARIIAKYWELFNNGQEPEQGSRNTKIYQLAYNLRSICDYNKALMGQVIPNYGLDESEKMACIDSAVKQRITQMPKPMQEVLAALNKECAANSDDESSKMIDEALTQDSYFFYNQLGRLPMGLQDSVNAVGPAMAMPMLVAIAPVIGALASEVELDVHGTYHNLNLISFIAGDFASGKGGLDPVIETWMNEVKAQDDLYHLQEQAYIEKKHASKNKKEQPVEPKLPVRFLTLNNTVANLAERLANTQGRHAYSFTPEADTVAQKWKSSMSDFSVMLRQAYDGSKYEREARSVDAVRVFINKLLWNVTMCGTPDALYRVVGNYTDGFQSRIANARTPDNTYSPLRDCNYVLTEKQTDQIRQVAHLLPLLKGRVSLPKLEAKGREWVERIRIESMLDDDRTKARQRFRTCVTAQRITCCMMICAVCEKMIKQYGLAGAELRLTQDPELWKDQLMKMQTPKMLSRYDLVADYLIDTALYFFRFRIEAAFVASDYVSGISERRRTGKNDSIYDRLSDTFTFDDAMKVSKAMKGASVTLNTVKQMLKNWRKQQLICQAPNNQYRKLLER